MRVGLVPDVHASRAALEAASDGGAHVPLRTLLAVGLPLSILTSVLAVLVLAFLRNRAAERSKGGPVAGR